MGLTSDQIKNIRLDFGILNMRINNRPLTYFDNAATTQKPQIVIDRIKQYYERENSNVHRGVHYLSQIATMAYEGARESVQAFINAAHSHEIIFTRGTTESINLVASSFSEAFLNEGDKVLVSEMEHHSNIVPWQMACEKKKAILKYIPIDDNGDLMLEDLESMLKDGVKIVAITHISNALGTINPVKEIIEAAHSLNIPVLIDGAQSSPHLKIDVQDLDADFYCFSGHKMYGPMGVGVLYGKETYLNALPPYQGGGEMIKTVSLTQGTTYNDLPFKFEAGTPNVADVLGLEAAIQYINALGIENISNHEHDLLTYATEKLSTIENLKITGTAPHKASVISFNIKGVHPYDIGTLLDKTGIAIRTGHHCAQPVMDRYGISGTVRLSFAVYNTKEEVDSFCEALNKVLQMLL